ncbi:PPC domain-containing protein [Planctomicrobium piriforme]|nr:PPC domain-containing protein [Planctomicrobium piriforme]
MHRLSAVGFFFTALLLASSSEAAQPKFKHLSPLAGQRGTEVDVVLYGDNLDDAEELLLYDTGLEVLKFEKVAAEEDRKQGKRVTVRFKIAADCPLGAQRMRIRTRTGMSDLQNFHVGALPLVSEKEPNTQFETPQVLAMNTSVEGRVDREDVDYYEIEAKAGQRITAEIFGQRLGRSSGSSYFDPFLAILNSERFELAVNDDTPLVWNDSMVSVVAPADGKYTILVRDASYNGDGQAHYVLHVGNFPRPTAVLPAGGKPGETLKVTFLGDVAGPIEREITLPTTAPADNFGLEVQDDQGIAPSRHPFRIVDLQNILEQEPNNDRNVATAGPLPAAFNGVIGAKSDIDFFKFAAKKDQTVNVEVYARRIRSGLDPVVSVHQMSDGKGLGSDDDSRGVDCAVKVKIPADGEYVVAVRDHLNRGEPTFTYRIEVTELQPEVFADPIEFARYVQPQIIIPQGGGCGVVANIQRREFGGPVNFRSDSLPPGVRMECPESWRADGTASVVFFADETAPLGGKYSSITAFLDDPKQPALKIEGEFRQDVLMIRANNNDRVWEERMHRLPIVVVEKAPFKCWIEMPKVPVVQNGSLNLVVKCEKAEGWDEEINMQLLQNPPGVSSNGSAKIPKGATEGVIAVNASDKASVRESMVSARCSAKHAGGEYELATPFVPIKVEEKYVTFEFAQGAVEQGKETPYLIKVTKRKDFEGEAVVELLGLPANATAEKLNLTKDTAELLFTIKAAADTPVGMSQNVFCKVDVPENGAIVTHSLGNGRLRVDKPAPPPKTTPETPAAPPPAEVAKTEAPPKPLSRLEQLRVQQKQREAGGGE